MGLINQAPTKEASPNSTNKLLLYEWKQKIRPNPQIKKYGGLDKSNPYKPTPTSIINKVDLINQVPTKEASPNSTNKLRLYE